MGYVIYFLILIVIPLLISLGIPTVVIYFAMFMLYRYVIKPTPGFGKISGIVLLVFMAASYISVLCTQIPFGTRGNMQSLFFYTYLVISGLYIAHQRYMYQARGYRLLLLLLGGFIAGMLFLVSIRALF
ncbi:MAG: hypothetical protein EOP51_25700 [Sphingobacteriales bacterium]|nr:MAG: hypothetical protein EOP51_25700 [Sphingobacteriales bacterium]